MKFITDLNFDGNSLSKNFVRVLEELYSGQSITRMQNLGMRGVVLHCPVQYRMKSVNRSLTFLLIKRHSRSKRSIFQFSGMPLKLVNPFQ
ncbi:hypothetical protein MKW98_015870 [Papaver atlanticum]|uniref:Uncharacterized protein n=1 Tax=Papaver atlanticum TaxID=357466 RepID=A0AAD4STJ2_9MAGN|nr:hypothetical protein MKW98_015870 [Papaver atlanticum]